MLTPIDNKIINYIASNRCATLEDIGQDFPDLDFDEIPAIMDRLSTSEYILIRCENGGWKLRDGQEHTSGIS